MPDDAPVRIPITFDTAMAQRTLEVLKGGFNAAAGDMKGSMNAVVDGLTRDLRTRLETAAQVGLDVQGRRLSRATGADVWTDTFVARASAQDELVRRVGMAGLRMSDEQLQAQFRIIEQRRERELGAERRVRAVTDPLVASGGETAQLVGALTILNGLLTGLKHLMERGMNGLLGRLGLGSVVR